MIRSVGAWIGRGIRRALRLIGIAAFRERAGYHYVPDYYGRSAGKHDDIRTLPVFGQLANDTIAQQRTLLYYDRLYTIYQALRHVKNLPASRHGFNIAEVGVYKGGTSYFMASMIDAIDLKPTGLHCFDTFEGHPGEDIRTQFNGAHVAKTFGDTSFEAVQGYLSRFNNVALYKGRFQETCHQVESLKFHFVHLDVDIYEPMTFALDFFDSRLVVGGSIVVDDYGFLTCLGVKQAVTKFLASQRNYFSLHLLTGQNILIKTSREG